MTDKRNEACRSWQIIVFQPRPVSFIKITGTHNTANEVFHCVHFECPCDSDVLSRYLECQNVKRQESPLIQLTTPTSSSSTSSSSNRTYLNSNNSQNAQPSHSLAAAGATQNESSTDSISNMANTSLSTATTSVANLSEIGNTNVETNQTNKPAQNDSEESDDQITN